MEKLKSLGIFLKENLNLIVLIAITFGAFLMGCFFKSQWEFWMNIGFAGLFVILSLKKIHGCESLSNLSLKKI